MNLAIFGLRFKYMTLVRKKNAVLKLFRELDLEISKLAVASGLSCKPACGDCCLYPDVHATALEFLPFAYNLLIENKAQDYHQLLKSQNSDDKLCILYSPLQFSRSGGGCTDYSKRGLICRLFGFSAQRKKDDSLSLITCKIIKGMHNEFFENESTKLALIRKVPVAANY